jgi:serine/threonine-protein kinase
MLTEDGSVKVTDFGIARALDDSEELTRTGAVIGTATYFSPEQAQGLPADERSDVYSLGVVLYEMLAGRAPFTGESPVAVAYQHVSEPAAPPQDYNPDAPLELSAIATHAIKKRADERYQSADDMRADLLRYLGGAEPMAAGFANAAAATALIPPPAGLPVGMGAGQPMAATSTFDAPVQERSQTGYWAAVGGLLVILVLGIWLLFRLLSPGTVETTTVIIPDLRDTPSAEAFEILQNDLDLKVRTREETNEEIAAGRVIRTDPAAGSEIAVGEFVTVYVSLGPAEFGVPNLLGENVDIARARIQEQGFTIGVITYQPTEDTDENIVINQSPPGGTTAPPGTSVDLVVSAGPAAIEIPDVSGTSSATAVLQLARAGFTNIETDSEFSPDVPEGFVIATNPASGQVIPKEATIIVIVSDGPEPVVLPDLMGKTENEARTQLNGLGLTMVVNSQTVEVPLASGLVGKVVEQSPGKGAEVEVGSQVTVKMGVVRKVTVPNLFQMTIDDAQTAAEAVGLTIDISVVDPPVSTPDKNLDGKVASQKPLAGAKVDEGSIIVVVLYQWDGTTTTTAGP